MKTNRQGNKSLIENETWRVENILVRAGKAARLVGRGLRTMLFPFQLPRTRCNAHCHPSHTITSTHTHTHTCCGCIPQKDRPRYGAQQSVPLSLTSMHPLVHSRLTLGANINSPICRHGRRNCANVQSAEALLLLADLHQRGKRGRNAGSAKSASARPELSKMGRSSIPVHRTSSKGEVELKM